jgi:hypothetical protein
MKEVNPVKRFIPSGGIAAAAVLAWTTTSLADDTTVVPPANTHLESNPPAVAEKTSSAPPDIPLVTGGLITLTGAYVPSVIVAAANDNPWDHKLFIPVVGPWMDLAQRPGTSCNLPPFPSCGAESGDKALLIIDGAFQALGALAAVLGFVTPERRTTTVVPAKAGAAEREKRNEAHVQLVPTTVGRDAYGLAAFGSF